MKTFRNLFKVTFGRRSKEPYRVIIFYSCFISFTICLSLFLNIFTFSRNFFGNNTILVFSTLFTSTIVSSSDSFNVIVKTAVQMVISCIVGDIVAYASVAIFVDHLWITIFLYLLFMLLTSGFLLSSKTLPWPISKRMYFEYFLLVYVIKPTNRSPIIFLKSGLASIFTMIFALVGCFIMNPFFSSQLYLRTAARAIHRSHQSTKLLGRQLEIKTMSELKSPLERKTHKKILYDIHSRLLQSKSNIPIFFNQNQNNSNNSNNIQSPTSTTNQYKIKKNIKVYLNKFQYLKSLKNSSNINNNNNNNNNNINLNTSHSTPTTLRYKRDIIINNSNEIINNYKNQLVENNIKYALDLNRLERYFEESKMEVWNKDLVANFNELSMYLEKIYNIINSMQVLIESDLSTKRCKLLLPLVPHVNSIIHLSNNISIIMENQLLGNYRVNKIRDKFYSIINNLFKSNNNNNNINNNVSYNSNQDSNQGNNQDSNQDNNSSGSGSDIYKNEKRMNKKELYKKSLEYSQVRVIKYFERIDTLIEILKNEYYQVEVTKDLLEFDQESQCELSRIHFFLNLLSSFTITQKRLSNLVDSSSKCLYRHHQIYHIEMFILIGYWVLNLPSRFKLFMKIKYHHENQQSASFDLLEPKFTNYEKLKLFTNSMKSRLLFKWRFSLKFSIFMSIITITYYQITIHSTFVLFRALTWYIIPILYVSAPSIGASGFSCCMRFFGTLFGVFTAYTVGVLFSLTNHDGTKALCYVSLTFFIMAVINYIARGRPIQSFGNFFILAYATITFPEFTQDHALILNTLLRWFDISLAVFTIMALSFILPYYDHKELQSNLLDVYVKELESFKKIINYHFSLNILEYDKSSYNSNNDSISQPITSILNDTFISTPTSISTPVSIISIKSSDNNSSSGSITFQNNLRSMFHGIRSKITQQRSLLFNSRFELVFQKKKFTHLQELLGLISSQYKILVSLEYVILSNNFNNNKYDSYFLDQVKLSIIPKLKYIVSELDYNAESIIEIKQLKSSNRLPLVFPTNLRVLIEEVYFDYHSLVYLNSCDVEHSFCIHQLGCLLYTFDLFIMNHQKICNHIWILWDAIKVERSDLISNLGSIDSINGSSKDFNQGSFSINSSSKELKQKRNDPPNASSVTSTTSNNSSSNSSIGSSITSRYLGTSPSSTTSTSSPSSLFSTKSSPSSPSSSFSSLEISNDIDMFIPYTRDSKKS